MTHSSKRFTVRGAEEPPEALDHAILAAAKAPTDTTRRRWLPWAGGFATAAVLLLSIGVVLQAPPPESDRLTIPLPSHSPAQQVAPAAADPERSALPNRVTPVSPPQETQSSRSRVEGRSNAAPTAFARDVQPAKPKARVQKATSEAVAEAPAPSAPTPKVLEQTQSAGDNAGAVRGYQDAQIEEIIVTGARRNRCTEFEQYGGYQVCDSNTRLAVKHQRCKGSYHVTDVLAVESSTKGVIFRTEEGTFRLRCGARGWRANKRDPAAQQPDE